MSYFPRTFMPLSIKQNAIGSNSFTDSTITAEQYNALEEEILAIEEYIGLNNSTQNIPGIKDEDKKTTDSSILNEKFSSSEKLSLLKELSYLTEASNFFVTRGMQNTSGYLLNNQKIIFSEEAHFSYLTETPNSTDSIISVDSTIGFPESGTISILNNISQITALLPGVYTESVPGGQTMTEWIRYNGKTSTQFLNCERGFLNTYAGAHYASKPLNSKNMKYMRTLVPTGFDVYTRWYPGTRFRIIYKIPCLGILGTKQKIANSFRLYPYSFNINNSNCETLRAAAEVVGILNNIYGSYFLASKDSEKRKLNQLTSNEAFSFVDQMISNSAAVVIAGPDNLMADLSSVPVFSGRMNVQYGLSNYVRNYDIKSIEIYQSANGSVTIGNKNARDHILLSYSTFFVSNTITQNDYDSWEQTRNI